MLTFPSKCRFDTTIAFGAPGSFPFITITEEGNVELFFFRSPGLLCNVILTF